MRWSNLNSKNNLSFPWWIRHLMNSCRFFTTSCPASYCLVTQIISFTQCLFRQYSNETLLIILIICHGFGLGVCISMTLMLLCPLVALILQSYFLILFSNVFSWASFPYNQWIKSHRPRRLLLNITMAVEQNRTITTKIKKHFELELHQIR